MQLSNDQPSRSRFTLLKRFFVFTGLLVIGAGIFVAVLIKQQFGLNIGHLLQFATNDFSGLKKISDRTNILLLGIGGDGHEGGKLTDTMLVLSFNLKTHDQFILSLPRDIWIPSLKDRINTAFVYGEEKSPGGGFVLAKSVVEEVTGMPIHYAALVDFAGFEKMIDIVSGINVVIDESFTDPEFPIKGKEEDLCNGDLTYSCRYESITFTKGIEHMNGERALKYVRSRHAEGDVGTDFSRGKRQQAVLKALKAEVLQKETITDLNKLQQLRDVVNKTITTDIAPPEELLLAKFVIDAKSEVRTALLTQSLPAENKKGLLINPPVFNYDGKWVLIPKADDYSLIHQYVSCMVDNKGKCEELLN